MMNHRPTLLAGAALLAAVIGQARPAAAEDPGLGVTLEPPRRRQGYYLGFGFGTGAAQTWDDGERLDAGPGSKFALRMGQLLTQRFGLGLAIETGGASIKKDKTTVGFFGMAVEGQAVLATNLALHGTVGFGVIEIKSDEGPDKKLRGSYGTQYGLGLSYDWFPRVNDSSGGLAITPTFDVRFLPESSATSVAGFLGVELGWWTGLPKNQLELPDNEAYRK